ncbi:unnamed protein product [Rhodiola kirilowii]
MIYVAQQAAHSTFITKSGQDMHSPSKMLCLPRLGAVLNEYIKLDAS